MRASLQIPWGVGIAAILALAACEEHPKKMVRGAPEFMHDALTGDVVAQGRLAACLAASSGCVDTPPDPAMACAWRGVQLASQSPTLALSDVAAYRAACALGDESARQRAAIAQDNFTRRVYGRPAPDMPAAVATSGLLYPSIETVRQRVNAQLGLTSNARVPAFGAPQKMPKEGRLSWRACSASVCLEGLTPRFGGGLLSYRVEVTGAVGPARLLAAKLATGGLEADESLLSGESAPVEKVAAPEPGPLVRPGGEQTASVYAGTLLVRGMGVALVAAIGAQTEMGRIGRALEGISPDAGRLTLQTRRLVRSLGLLAALVCGSVVLILGLRGGAWPEGLLGGVAVGMAMIPEEFPLVLTVFMVMGAWRISRAGVLTRKAAAIEILGSATVLCTDKTGTLTESRMTVVGGWKTGRFLDAPREGAASEDMAELVRIGVLSSSANPFDPMERAFLTAAGQPAPADWSLVQVYGLRPELLAVTQIWGQAERAERLVAAKGAPEAIADLCRLDPEARAQVMDAVEHLAAHGMRVLGVAQGRFGAANALPNSPTAVSLDFAGLVGLADPVRPDVPEAVAACQAAGIRVVMITGDYPATAKAIAAQAGIAAPGLMTGAELAALDDEGLKATVGTIGIFARILPEQKLRIVRALKASGEIVAMTGDGVNDAPALKAADIGVAMGDRGSDVAREASSLVLLKDGFGAIVQTIRLGRRIYGNLRHSMGFILAVHLPIAGLAVVPLLTGGGILLGPIHIAFLEMFIDPVCAIAFEAEPEDPQAMRRPPRNPAEKLFSGRALLMALARGTTALIAVLAGLRLHPMALWPDTERPGHYLRGLGVHRRGAGPRQPNVRSRVQAIPAPPQPPPVEHDRRLDGRARLGAVYGGRRGAVRLWADRRSRRPGRGTCGAGGQHRHRQSQLPWASETHGRVGGAMRDLRAPSSSHSRRPSPPRGRPRQPSMETVLA
jgi:Ca2+-transporting ATPase